MALTKGLLDQYWQRYNQRRALTGLPSSYQEMRGTLDPMLEQAYQKDIQEKQLLYNNQERNRQLSLQERQARDQARAANVSGAMNIAGLGVQGYLGYKTLTKPASASETATTNYLNSLTAKNQVGAGSSGVTVQPGAGSGTLPPSAAPYDATATQAYDASIAEGAAQGVGTAPVADAGVGMGGASQYGTAYGVGAGILAGAATNYAVTRTGEGRDSNARVADFSRNYLGMTNWSDADYASKGSATVGGLAGGGAWGAAISNVGWDIGKAFQTGKVSNELIGIPFADKIFNTDLGSIFGW